MPLRPSLTARKSYDPPQKPLEPAEALKKKRKRRYPPGFQEVPMNLVAIASSLNAANS